MQLNSTFGVQRSMFNVQAGIAADLADHRLVLGPWLPPDPIPGDVKISGDLPSINFAIMKQGQKHRLCDFATKQVLEHVRNHDL